MMRSPDTIWARLEECIGTLHEPFRASEIIGWFRRHYPDVKESSLRAHIQSATSNVEARGSLGYRAPLITRIDRGLYRRATPMEVTASGQLQSSDEPPAPVTRTSAEESASALVSSAHQPEAWHHEAAVQATVVTHLAKADWQILSAADTASKAHGIDIVAQKDDQTIGIEVKGFPSRRYADPARAHEAKPTQPSTQARVWYASALLAALRLRTRQPDFLSVIAIPDFPTYRNLYADTAGPLSTCGVQVWWVSQSGVVTESPAADS